MNTMNAMVLKHYGDDADFESVSLPVPVVQAGHVLVRIAATSVNTVDTMIRQMGKTLPLSPDLPALLGMDFSGVVEAVGEGVTAFNIDDEVFGCAGGLSDLPGALAEYMLVDAQLIAHKPKNLSMREAAALPLVGITAFEGLQRAAVNAGQRVLVHGGVGGVGHVAVQLAKYWGADVYATVSQPNAGNIVTQYGATPINYQRESVADYTQQYTDGAGFDVVFDTVGGTNMAQSFEATALNGHVSTTVSLVELDLSTAHFKGLSIHVVFMLIPMLYNHQRAVHGNILSELATIAEAGGLKPLLDEETYRLADVHSAYARLSSGQAMGKVVIEIE